MFLRLLLLKVSKCLDTSASSQVSKGDGVGLEIYLDPKFQDHMRI